VEVEKPASEMTVGTVRSVIDQQQRPSGLVAERSA
jgi:hypothetical protein